MKPKSNKVEEPAAPYATKPAKTPEVPVQSSEGGRKVRYASPEEVRKAADKIFKVHHELFRKLSQ